MHDLYDHVKSEPGRRAPSRSGQLKKAKAILQKKAQEQAKSGTKKVEPPPKEA